MLQKIEQIISTSTPTLRIVNVHLLAVFRVLSQRSVWFAQNPRQKTQSLWTFYAVIVFKKNSNIFQSFS